MPTLKTKLTPFWYEPEFQNGERAKFRLKPLTQRDMIEIDDFCDEAGNLTRRAQYEAGLKAITAIEGFTDEAGNDVRWPGCSALVERHLITQCGFRAIMAQKSEDWDAIVARIKAALSADSPPEPASDDPGGAEKN